MTWTPERWAQEALAVMKSGQCSKEGAIAGAIRAAAKEALEELMIRGRKCRATYHDCDEAECMDFICLLPCGHKGKHAWERQLWNW